METDKWNYALNLLIRFDYGDTTGMSGDDIDISNMPYLYDRNFDTKYKFPFTYESFCRQEDIIETLEKYELETEPFWYAMCVIYLLTKENCTRSFAHIKTLDETLRQLECTLEDARKFTMKVDGKKPLVISDSRIINAIKERVKSFREEMKPYDSLTAFSFQSDARTESMSVWIWYAASLFQMLYKALHLPDKRARKRIETRKRGCISDKVEVTPNFSYNKTLLTSRLIYFMGFTNNKAFTYDDNSLKAIMKEYKDKNLAIFFA